MEFRVESSVMRIKSSAFKVLPDIRLRYPVYFKEIP